ncbi:hypothetical protein Y1Q_0008675 [Alligator mississippiensis]|uniref:Uncharacterized protein n=1 Tax=Alligator mississippiensis TaxID=8496 RepID=A0A151N9I0_ALLMI|nr:hypothetical protein Y1Q_0008675 [Alligator mississippiensis]
MAVPCRATHPILYPPGILNLATNFHMANEDETIQDSMDTGVLWYHFQLVEHQFWARTINSNGDHEQWLQTFHMCQATFLDSITQRAPHIVRQDIGMQLPSHSREVGSHRCHEAGYPQQ